MTEIVLLALVGNGIAVGVFCGTVLGGVPLLLALPGEQYVRAHGFLATRYDPFMPITIATTVLADILGAIMASPLAAHLLCAVATILMASVMTVSVTKNVPINRWVSSQDPQALPSDWPTRRLRWQKWNAIRTALATTALAVNLAAAVVIVW
ncbi:DUF1772 domain-containing protein [Actinoallomurus sp. NPDC052274]|uniref:DUF1772 domain-containing protein n=1 Tax=Actinoallomurus sp. NPDC052274 TaxID=3155420 RepID=UPI0034455D21